MILKLAELCSPKIKLAVVDDKTDNRILECAVAGKAHLTISGDNDLLRLKTYENIPIQKPKYLTYLIKTEDQ